MAKVTVHRGITIPNPKVKYNMYRSDITIEEIDTEGDIEKQIEEAFKVYDEISEAINEPLAQSIADVSNLGIEGLGLASEFESFLETDKVWKESVVGEVKKLQKSVENVTNKDG